MRVLFVDDEPNVLDSMRRQLRKVCEIHTAASGEEALRLLKELGPVALVVSDMRMPGMNGAELLTAVRELYPDTVRMVLSGQADLESTISAVNDGHIFRFLTKPCSEEALRAAVRAGVEQYELVTTRRELLEKTLQGLVETLNDILGLTNPVARRRTARIRQYAAAIAGALSFAMPWDLRLATLLSQLGCITLPEAILDKLYAGTDTVGGRATPLRPAPGSRCRTHRPDSPASIRCCHDRPAAARELQRAARRCFRLGCRDDRHRHPGRCDQPRRASRHRRPACRGPAAPGTGTARTAQGGPGSSPLRAPAQCLHGHPLRGLR